MTMTNGELFDAAIKAIDAFVGDTSVSPETTADKLGEIISHAEAHVTAIEDGLEEGGD